MLHVALLTLGDPNRLTGGYLYHRRMAKAAAAHDARVTFLSYPRPFPRDLRATGRLLREAGGADVLVLDSIVAAYLGLRSGRIGIPLVGSLHQPPGGVDHRGVGAMLQRPFDLRAYRRTARLVVAAESLVSPLVSGGIPEARIRVIPPGRDGASPPQDPSPELRAGRRMAVLAVASWLPHKGILPLLEAVSRLPLDAVTLHLAGDTEADPRYAERVWSRLAASDLRGRVTVYGALPPEGIGPLYAGADVFALPAQRETYGTVFGEALAAGLPVVGYAAGNVPHLVTHGREGLLFQVGDVDGLSRALRRLAYDPPLRGRMSASARQRAAKLPTWAASAGLFFAVLREAAAEGVR